MLSGDEPKRERKRKGGGREAHGKIFDLHLVYLSSILAIINQSTIKKSEDQTLYG